MTNLKELRMQLDLRRVITEYQAKGWVVQRGDPLTMTREGIKQHIEVRDGLVRLV